MADPSKWNQRTVLMDVTYTKMDANVPLTSPLSGSKTSGNSTAQVTPNSIESCSIDSGYAADGYILEITPPVTWNSTNQAFSTPDVEVTFVVDGKPMTNYQVIDGSATGNMFPRQAKTFQGKQRTLGTSLRSVADKLIKGQRIPRNIPLLVTGLKANQSYQVTVTSQAGWGVSDTVVTPLRVVLRGDLWGQNEFLLYGAALNALNHNMNINVAKDGLGAYLNTYFFPTALDTKSFVTLPGGSNQGATKINKLIKYATNAQEIGVSGNYAFTNSQSLKGNPSNIVDENHDLGDNFIDSRNFFNYEYLGIRLAAGVFGSWGFLVNGSVVPLTTQNGMPVSYGDNDWQYGNAQPQLSQSDLYLPLPDVRELVDMMSYKSGVTPFFSGVGNTNPVAAGSVTIVKGGVLVESN